MKIASLKTFVTSPPTGIGGAYWLLVKVSTDDGIEGVGECYGIPFPGDIAASMVEDTFQRYFVGQDPHHIELLYRRVYSSGFTQRPDLCLVSIFSGLEMALWDILGKAHGQPVCQLLGGRFHQRLRTYTYIYPDILGPDAPDVYHQGEAAAEAAIKYLELGFTALKQDPAGPYGMQGGRELSLVELERCDHNVKCLRQAVGSRADLLFGTHGQMTTSSAIRLAQRLEKYDPLWFEEPCPPDQMEAIGRVAQAISIPVATGERLSTRVEFHQALKAGVSILQPNVGRSGGLWETKKIASLAEVFNAQLAPHIYCGPVAHAAATHLGFSCPNFLILETIQTDFHDAVLKKPLLWESGFMLYPSEPGLGIELDEEVLAEHPYSSDAPLHLGMCQVPLDSANEKIISDLT